MSHFRITFFGRDKATRKGRAASRILPFASREAAEMFALAVVCDKGFGLVSLVQAVRASAVRS